MTLLAPEASPVSIARGSARVRSVAAVACRRLASAVLVLWGAITLTFLALQVMPGSTLDAITGLKPTTPQLRAEIVRQYGLDRPLVVQYLTYLMRVARGRFGDSYVAQVPVRRAIGQQLGSTMTLLLATLLITVVVSVLLALLTAGRGRTVGAAATFGETLGVAIPPFWAGIVLLTVFSFRLHWFPAVAGGGIRGLVLPAVTLAIAPVATITRVLRQGLDKALGEPFVLTARTRGVRETAVRYRHALRHAVLPVITLIGWLAGVLIGGAVVIEQVFSRRGLGQLAVSAVTDKDLPMITGIVVVVAIGYVLINLVVDLLYEVIDPRLRDAR